MTEGLLFSTSGSEHLVEPVLQKASLRPALYRLGNFVDGEIMFYLDEPVKDKACFVLGHTSALAENLLRLLTIINTLRIHGAKPITAVIPYFGYGRSDKAKPGQPVNARLFAGFLKQAGADKVICLDLHSQLVEDYLTMPVTHLSAIPLMAEELQPTLTSDFGVASPDKGGVNRAKEFARNLGIKHIIEITKSRPTDNLAEIRTVSGDVRGKDVVIVDDIIETGHTLIEAAKALKKLGARRLYAAVTHCVYQAKGINLVTKSSLFTKIIVTNSLSDHFTVSPNITILDIAPLLSKAIDSALLH